MALLMPKLTGDDLPAAKKWIEEVTALFERDGLDTAGESAGGSGSGSVPMGGMLLWVADPGGGSNETMTGPSSPSPCVASASSEWGTGQYPAWDAFDYGVAGGAAVVNGWHSSDTSLPQWLKIRFTADPRTYTSCHIDPLKLDSCPRDFEIQGSNDNAVWTTLKALVSETGWTGRRDYTFDVTGSYEYYRLYITDNNGDSQGTAVAEWRLKNIVTPPEGYLWADGDVVTQAAYPDLYAVIGDQFNTGGEPVGSFRLPDATETVDGVLLRRIIRAL